MIGILVQNQGKYLQSSNITVLRYCRVLILKLMDLYVSVYRTIVAEGAGDSKYYDSRSIAPVRDIGIKSRLDSSPSKSRTMGVLSRPKMTSVSPQTTGYRIVVSNLQANVTQEDIKVKYARIIEKTLFLNTLAIVTKY